MSPNPVALLELAERIEQLAQFQDRIEIPASIPRIWDAFLRDARNLIEIESAALFTVEETTQEFVLASAAPENLMADFQKEVDAQIEVGTFSVILKRRLPSFTPSLTLRNRLSVVMLPLATVKRTLGMVMVLTPFQESRVTQENMRLLAVLARQCSLVMENSTLYEKLRRDKDSLEEANRKILYLSQRDALTGCFNRGYMNDQLPREIRRALRYRRALSIALCDLDHFKSINDSYGHQCGDRILKDFVKSLNELVRTDSDWLARYGGEEFLLVLPETALGNAERLAERLRAHIAGKSFAWQEETISITASFGVVGFSAGQLSKSLRAEALLNRADEYLYRAKQQGRNRVVSGPFA
ncbi:MAG TPA: sensor domain-containing diguanylate cyclase [Desulfobacterales bacterium]|nr:sensor domain-containing diguanylate cyclase [Desulfobacterales bacterium]